MESSSSGGRPFIQKSRSRHTNKGIAEEEAASQGNMGAQRVTSQARRWLWLEMIMIGVDFGEEREKWGLNANGEWQNVKKNSDVNVFAFILRQERILLAIMV